LEWHSTWRDSAFQTLGIPALRPCGQNFFSAFRPFGILAPTLHGLQMSCLLSMGGVQDGCETVGVDVPFSILLQNLVHQ